METEAICTVWTQTRSNADIFGSESFLLRNRCMREDRYRLKVGAFPFLTDWYPRQAGLTWWSLCRVGQAGVSRLYGQLPAGRVPKDKRCWMLLLTAGWSHSSRDKGSWTTAEKCGFKPQWQTQHWRDWSRKIYSLLLTTVQRIQENDVVRTTFFYTNEGLSKLICSYVAPSKYW